MNKTLKTAAASLIAFGLFNVSAMAENVEKRVIALSTSDFEIADTDISHLAVGDAETIITESGKTIDILRTEDGVEIYVDGQLLDMTHGDGHTVHKAHKRVVVECIDEEDCSKDIMVMSGDDMDFDFDMEALHEDGHQVFIKKVSSECVSDDEDACADQHVWISDDEGGEINIEQIIEAHGGEARVIRLHSDHDVEVNASGEDTKVVVIRKSKEEK